MVEEAPEDLPECQPLYCCPEDECEECFDTFKGVRLHMTGRHQFRACRYCGEEIRLRGHPRHEAKCAIETKNGPMVATLETLIHRIADFYSRAKDPPQQEGTILIIPTDGRPMVVRHPELAKLVGKGAFLVDTGQVNPAAIREAHRQRDRRKHGLADLSGRPTEDRRSSLW